MRPLKLLDYKKVLDGNARVLCMQADDENGDTGVSKWILDSVTERFDWPRGEQLMAKLDWEKTRQLGEVEEASPTGGKEVKFGTPTGAKKIAEARARAAARNRQMSVPQALPGKSPERPVWMKDPKLLPKRPPGHG